jgi:hypothetical protein
MENKIMGKVIIEFEEEVTDEMLDDITASLTIDYKTIDRSDSEVNVEAEVRDDFGEQYSQENCDDGTVILYGGKPMTPELIVDQLNELTKIKKRLYCKVIFSQNSR